MKSILTTGIKTRGKGKNNLGFGADMGFAAKIFVFTTPNFTRALTGVLRCVILNLVHERIGKKMLAIVERFQRKENAKFERMVQRSDIVKSKTVPVKKLNLYTDEKRKRSLILLIITFLYSMITKIILGDFSFDLLVVLNVLLFVTDFYLRVNGNSIWALNHYNRVRTFTILNKLLITIIFFMTSYLQLMEFIDFTSKHSAEFHAICVQYYYRSEELLHCFLYILKEKPYFTISFIYSIVMFIPILLFFIKMQVTYYFKIMLFMLVAAIPVVGVIFLGKWALGGQVFKEYSLLDEETCVINYRKSRHFSDNAKRIFGRLLLTIAVALLQYGVLRMFG